MLTLAFDTSTSKGGVALSEDGRILNHRSWNRDSSHGELLTPALQEALESADRRMEQVQLLAIGNGPGSFTGVRIAVNAARALAYSRKIPVAVFDSATLLAAGANRKDLPIAVMINAHKNLIFGATFRPLEGQHSSLARWQSLEKLRAMTLNEFSEIIDRPHLCLGDGYGEFADLMPQALRDNLVRDNTENDFPSAAILAQLASQSSLNLPPLVWNEVQALYIRASGAEENLKESKK
jgi:N6-L-threonylcarbamoyladenine synthase/tRNA threonylcarbamoyladenosine biosynthesis protein TsaB